MLFISTKVDERAISTVSELPRSVSPKQTEVHMWESCSAVMPVPKPMQVPDLQSYETCFHGEISLSVFRRHYKLHRDISISFHLRKKPGSTLLKISG